MTNPVQDVEVNAESWDRHAFEANDVGASYPDWRSIEEITEEGKEMAKRTTQLFQEAKKEKIIHLPNACPYNSFKVPSLSFLHQSLLPLA